MTDKLFQPMLLADKSRLQEIYELRVAAYENSPKSLYVNKRIFPNGWSDHLDDREQTHHFIVQDKKKIIASARFAILNDINEINEGFNLFELPAERPFAYYSRLVVHPDYRKLGLSGSLDRIRIDFISNTPAINFIICLATHDRHKALLDLGFMPLGEIEFNWGAGNYQSKQLQNFYFRK